MGLRNFLNRRSLSVGLEPPPASMAAAPIERVPLTAEQLADLDAARAELLELAAEVGVKESQRVPPRRESLAR